MKKYTILLYILACLLAQFEGHGQSTNSAGTPLNYPYVVNRSTVSTTSPNREAYRNYFIRVKELSGDTLVYFVDFRGKGQRVQNPSSGSAFSDKDFLNIADNTPPNAVSGLNQYTKNYVSIGGRVVFPGASLFVVDSLSTLDAVFQGDRGSRIDFKNSFTGDWQSLGLNGSESDLWLSSGVSGFNVGTSGGTNPAIPSTPYKYLFSVGADSVLTFHGYPNSRNDADVPANFLFTDNTRKLKSKPLTYLDGKVGVSVTAPLGGSGLDADPLFIDGSFGNPGDVLTLDSGNIPVWDAPSGGGGGGIVYSATAPSDTTKTWVYTGATVLKIWEKREYVNGQWRTNEWYDKVANVSSTKPPLFVLATGQSNMEGFGTPVTDTAYSRNVSVWDSVLVKWKTAIIGQYPIFGNSPSFHFAKAAANQEGGRIVRLIYHARGSQSIAAWSPYGSGAMWNGIIQRVTASGTTNVDVMLWHQGEADAAWTNQRYIDSMSVILSNLRGKPWFGKYKPVIFGGLVPNAAPGQTVAMEAIAKSDAFCTIADASYLTNSGVHFLETQYPELGKRYWNAYKGKDVVSWDRISDNIFTSKTVLVNYTPYELATPEEVNIKGRLNLNANTSLGVIGIGRFAASSNTSGSNLIAIGQNSQKLGTNAQKNVTIGDNTLQSNVSGGNNTVGGVDALKNCNGCAVNAIWGTSAGQNCTTCTGMAIIGAYTATLITTASYCFIAGQGSASSLTTGSELIVMGPSALNSVTSQSGDIAIGSYVLEKCTANDNTGVGRQSLRYQTTPAANTGIGAGSAQYNITGTKILAAGANSLLYNASSDNNTGLGAESFNSFNSISTLSVSLVDPATEKLTVGAHGYTVGTYHILKFNVVSGTAPGGLLNGLIFVALATSSTEIQLTQQNITDAGSGVFTVNTKGEYSNSTAVGYDSEPTASNQIVLGNTSATTILSTAGFTQTASANPNSFLGSVNVGTSTPVSNIEFQVAGDAQIEHTIAGGSAAPTVVMQSAAGTGAVASVAGKDGAFVISVTWGTAPTTSGDLIGVTFNSALPTGKIPVVYIGGNDGNVYYKVGGTASGFTIGSSVAPTPSGTTELNVIVISY